MNQLENDKSSPKNNEISDILTNTTNLNQEEFLDRKRKIDEERTAKEVLSEMGVGLLDDEDEESLVVLGLNSSMVNSAKKRRVDIENVNPNIISPSRTSLTYKSTCLSEAVKNQQADNDTSISSVWRAELLDEETPAQHFQVKSTPGGRHHRVNCCSTSNVETPTGLSDARRCSADAVSSPKTLSETCNSGAKEGSVDKTMVSPAVSAGCSSGIRSCDWPVSGGSVASSGGAGCDETCIRVSSCAVGSITTETTLNKTVLSCKPDSSASQCEFNNLSDEVMLSIFKWLPKRTLIVCMLVCRRWHMIASDEGFWQRLELGNRVIAKGAIGKILAKQPTIVRLASSEVGEWCNPCSFTEPSRIQYLDLSMSIVDVRTLNSILERCPQLRKLSLENVPVDQYTCKLIGRCGKLESLNVTMVSGITSSGLSSILQGCHSLHSLNISWCNLCSKSVGVLCSGAPIRLYRLNTAGCRKTMTDQLIGTLCSRCPRLQELDVSDCSRLTWSSLASIMRLGQLEHLAISRCYSIPPEMLYRLGGMKSLQYLEVWGMLTESALSTLKAALSNISINQFMHSAIARPTVGTRRTSIWGQRTRD